MSLKVRFTLRAESSATDPKTTVTKMYSMQFLDEDTVFRFSEKHKFLDLHDQLMALPVAKMAQKNITPRWATRSFKITLPDAIAALYADLDGNAVFLGTLLDELDESHCSASSYPSSIVPPSTPASRSLSTIVKDAVISKFGSKNSSTNAEAWLEIFETECRRLEIDESRFWEVIRLFLEESVEKWYTTIRLSTTSTSWQFWRTSFIDNFGQHRLSVARTAFSYRFLGGSLNEYVQNKLNLLASFNPAMHELDKMAHLTLGLPATLQERINFTEANNLNIIHMTCKQNTNATEDLKPAVEKLLEIEQIDLDPSHSASEVKSVRPQVLWALYFNCLETSQCDLSVNVPSNIYLTSGPDADIDFEFAVKQAKEIFKKMYPNEEFLPRAPDPEELLLDDEEIISGDNNSSLTSTE